MNRQHNMTSWKNFTEKQPIEFANKETSNTSESAAHVLEKYLVCDWMRTHVITVNPELRIERAWEQMARYGIRHLPVVKNGLLVGIVTERDLKRAVFAATQAPATIDYKTVLPGPNPGDAPVETIMTRSVSIAAPSENLQAVALRMLRDRIGALPVVSGRRRLLGILTLSDLVRAILVENEKPPVQFTFPTTQPSQTLSTKGEPVWDIQ